MIETIKEIHSFKVAQLKLLRPSLTRKRLRRCELTPVMFSAELREILFQEKHAPAAQPLPQLQVVQKRPAPGRISGCGIRVNLMAVENEIEAILAVRRPWKEIELFLVFHQIGVFIQHIGKLCVQNPG